MENLGIDTKIVIAQIINFGVFFYIFKRFMAKPFMDFVKREKKNVEENESLGAASQALQDKLARQESDFKERMKREQAKIIDTAKKEADVIKKDLVAQAERDAEEIRTRAESQIAREREELEEAAREAISRTSFTIVNKALDDVLTDDMKRRITDSMVKNLPSKFKLS